MRKCSRQKKIRLHYAAISGNPNQYIQLPEMSYCDMLAPKAGPDLWQKVLCLFIILPWLLKRPNYLPCIWSFKGPTGEG